MIDALPEIGDQFEIRAGCGDQIGIDAVGDGRHQHVGRLQTGHQFGVGHRRVVACQRAFEQFGHARFDSAHLAAGDEDARAARAIRGLRHR